MDSLFLKSIIIRHINNFVTILSNEFKIEKDLIIKKIYNNDEIIINNNKIDMIDIRWKYHWVFLIKVKLK